MSVSASSNWDFNAVYELLASLKDQDSSAQGLRRQSLTLAPEAGHKPVPHDDDKNGGSAGGGGVSLGDFSKIWNALGIKDVKVQHLVRDSIPTFEAATRKSDVLSYASDGALPAKNVRWRDEEAEDAELADTYDDSPPDNGLGLTKNQRKKRNRKARKQAEALLTTNGSSKKKTSDAESGEDTDNAVTPAARVASKATTLQSHTQPKKTKGPKTDIAKISAGNAASTNIAKISQAKSLLPAQVAPPKVTTPNTVPKATKPVQDALQQTPTRSSKLDRWPVARPYEEAQRSIVPGFILSEASPAAKPSAPKARPMQAARAPMRAYDEIQPLVQRSTEDRHWDLLLKLIQSFPEAKSSLLSPLSLAVDKPSPSGIHVFVDASNILIGFQKALKHARGIPEDFRVGRIFPSFPALALLLERRRPTCRRILVGSSPQVDAYQEAIDIGYETSILDRVYKAKELTDREKYFAQKASARSGQSSGYESSEGNTQFAGPRTWREQGVDELIHFKMLESIIDVKQSAAQNAMVKTDRPTMVLATGDAAEAEYSAGFLAQVKRALHAGWNVEVASWSLGLSNEYTRLARDKEFKDQFRIVLLDGFAEEIFQPKDEA